MHMVSAPSLNLRAEPRVSPATWRATLPQGHRVEKLEDGPSGWWKVRTTLDGISLEGFVAHRFLIDEADDTTPAANTVRPVHLTEDKPTVKRRVASGRAFPLGEPDRPGRRGATPQERVKELHKIVKYLDVENAARYQRGGGETYCNIYAYDVCYLAGAYLPRVWWSPKALSDLRQGRSVAVKYAETVRELNANALYDWLRDFGDRFGWRRVADVEELQRAANAGGIGIISAQRKEQNNPGHICVVVPERPPQDTAKRADGSVQLPLQSQAGATNFCYSCGTKRWWAGNQFRAFGFWAHD